MNDIIKELEGYIIKVQEFDKDAAQDASQLHSYLVELTQNMARANYLMAEYQRKFRQEKLVAYKKLTDTVIKDQKYFAPSLAKDYVDAQCNETGFVFDLAERVSRTCFHTLEAIRTIISSLKSERDFSKYAA